jgi:hypothetical protein
VTRPAEDAVLGVDALKLGLLEVRVQFDLVDRGDNRRNGEKPVEVVGHEVAHSNRPNLPVGEQLLERPVRVEGVLEAAGHGVVQQEQVDLLDAELLRALANACSVASYP